MAPTKQQMALAYVVRNGPSRQGKIVSNLKDEAERKPLLRALYTLWTLGKISRGKLSKSDDLIYFATDEQRDALFVEVTEGQIYQRAFTSYFARNTRSAIDAKRLVIDESGRNYDMTKRGASDPAVAEATEPVQSEAPATVSPDPIKVPVKPPILGGRERKGLKSPATLNIDWLPKDEKYQRVLQMLAFGVAYASKDLSDYLELVGYEIHTILNRLFRKGLVCRGGDPYVYFMAPSQVRMELIRSGGHGPVKATKPFCKTVPTPEFWEIPVGTYFTDDAAHDAYDVYAEGARTRILTLISEGDITEKAIYAHFTGNVANKCWQPISEWEVAACLTELTQRRSNDFDDALLDLFGSPTETARCSVGESIPEGKTYFMTDAQRKAFNPYAEFPKEVWATERRSGGMQRISSDGVRLMESPRNRYRPKHPHDKVEVPKVEVPKVEVPKVEVPKVEVPKVGGRDLPTAEERERIIEMLERDLSATRQRLVNLEGNLAFLKAIRNA